MVKLVIPVNVEFPIVVEASVDDPVVYRLPVVVRPDVFVVVALVVVAYKAVKYPSGENTEVAKVPVNEVNEFIKPVVNAPILPVIFVTVVDPNVDDPVVKKFPEAVTPVTVVEPELSEVTLPAWATKFVRVVEARVVEEVTARVPFVVMLPAEVMVALPKPEVPVAVRLLVVRVFEIFELMELEVVALVVEALLVAKLEVVPHSVVMVARVEFSVLIYPVRKAAI